MDLIQTSFRHHGYNVPYRPYTLILISLHHILILLLIKPTLAAVGHCDYEALGDTHPSPGRLQIHRCLSECCTGVCCDNVTVTDTDCLMNTDISFAAPRNGTFYQVRKRSNAGIRSYSKEARSSFKAILSQLPDSAITASTTYSGFPTRLSRLYTTQSPGCWASSNNNVNGDYLQVDMMERTTIIIVATQGRPYTNQWVTRYELQFSVDKLTWVYYIEEGGVPKEFIGNSDSDTVVEHELEFPFEARYVRLLPTAYFSWMSTRWELYRC